jgi:hypothetical protein
MYYNEIDVNTYRRTLLQIVAGLAGASQAGLASAATAVTKPAATGKPGDFDFLTGQWKIQNRRLKGGAWDSFDGEASVIGILGGIASVEELRIPSRGFSGMGLRLLDTGTGLWADYWVNGSGSNVNPAPVWGGFANGAGTWDEQVDEGGKRVTVRGVWDQITPVSCRWRQAVSRDEGRTWEENWIMHFQRA